MAPPPKKRYQVRQENKTARQLGRMDRDKAGFAAGFNVTGDRSAAISSGVSSVAQAAVAMAGAASGAGAAASAAGAARTKGVGGAAVESAGGNPQVDPQLKLPNIEFAVDTVPFYQKPWFLITVVVGLVVGALALVFGGRKRKRK